MSKLPKKRPSKIKLEDLFRLKRSERPSDQFWDEFDRKLYQSILKAQAKKDPWHLQVMRGFSCRVLSGAAIAAIAVVLICHAVCFQPKKFSPSVNVPQEPVPEATGSISEEAVSEFILLKVTRLIEHCNSYCVDFSSYSYLPCVVKHLIYRSTCFLTALIEAVEEKTNMSSSGACEDHS